MVDAFLMEPNVLIIDTAAVNSPDYCSAVGFMRWSIFCREWHSSGALSCKGSKP